MDNEIKKVKSLIITDDLHSKLKAYCQLRLIKINAFVERIIEEALKK